MNIEALKSIYPFLETGIIGNSVLGNPIPYIKLGIGKAKVCYTASIHANEWISSSLLMKFIEDFCLAYVNNTPILGYNTKHIFNNISIYLIPMCNPDGVNLVTKQIKSNTTVYNQAKQIALQYPRIPFPSGWKANISGESLINFHH